MPSSPDKPALIQKPVHGGITLGELRALGLGEVVDFSSSVTPLGPSPLVREALLRVDLAAYPDPESLELRGALSKATGVPVGQIVPGNGSTELIYLLASEYVRRGDAAVILTPTFGEYEAACRLAGAETIFIRGEERHGFKWNVPAACRLIEKRRPRLVFLCNPNNPTAAYLERDDVQALAEAARPGILVVDEAYVAFVTRAWDATGLLSLGNVVLLRSMTKDYALAGLRLGYALCPPEAARLIFMRQPSWSVNSAAQAAGLAALADRQHLVEARTCVEKGRRYLARELEALGLKVLPAAANFLLVEVGDAAHVRSRLLRRGICVRDCSSFGLPRHIRVAVLTQAECAKLIGALKDVLCRDEAGAAR